ncbi:MAG: 16S rRNA (cytosine(967)-C(5))-methyltransferase RsmB [Firmicutes bacterium]|nr:16S rRNA (cytosine(967)-C(5))-methyltransferase RsmB [Bacillota bacterium]MBR6503470.1 16S rRNA (cytosine(967)-C(5))-methyltransferase RsmB [Bacillota bacterium]
MERKIAFDILNQIEQKGAYSNLAVNEALKKAGNNADGAFVRRIVYGVLENRIRLDYYISRFLKSHIDQVKRKTLNLLRMSVYQILFMDAVPDYAAVDEAVKIAKEELVHQDGFVNGVLRNVIRNKDSLRLPDPKKDPLKHLSVRYSFPEWMIRYLSGGYGQEFTERFLASAADVPPMTVRVNRLKTTPEELRRELEGEGFEVLPGRNSENALQIRGRDALSAKGFEEGRFTVQDEASMMAVEALDPRPGDTVIDLCAAPGGKTVYAGERMENRGRIIACDLSASKLDIVRRTAEKHGVTTLECEARDATERKEEFLGLADRVLCDVPCSGLGVIRRKPEIRYTKSMEDIRKLCRVQYRILENGASYLKPGGVLVYSTCTVSPLENQQLIDHFFKKHGQAFEEVFRKQYSPASDGTDGFFICKITKKS